MHAAIAVKAAQSGHMRTWHISPHYPQSEPQTIDRQAVGKIRSMALDLNWPTKKIETSSL